MDTISKSLAHAAGVCVVVFEAGNIGALEVATPNPSRLALTWNASARLKH